MVQKIRTSSTAILAIFRPADPVRQILRDYTSRKGFTAFFYDHLLDAISRMPLNNHDCTTLVITRPESFSAEGQAAFEMLLGREKTQYALWLENGDTRPAMPHSTRPIPLYCIENAPQLGAILEKIEANSHNKAPKLYDNKPPMPCRRPLDIPRQPLSNEELEALLEIGL